MTPKRYSVSSFRAYASGLDAIGREKCTGYQFARGICVNFNYLLLTAAVMVSGCGGGSGGGGADSGAEPGSAITMTEPAPFPAFSDDQATLLTQNAARESVIVTDSGLQYEVLIAADGPKPSDESHVTVHYRGTFTNGTDFDSSFDRGEPSVFKLNDTIQGWIEGLQLMSVGSRYRFVVPSDLAYGAMGAGDVIGPDQALIFVVQLMEINSI